MKIKHKYILLLTFVFIGCHFATSAIENYKFRALSPQGGFYHDGVAAIEHDKDGFVWIKLDDDILRFDGYEYKHYFHKIKSLIPDKRWNITGIDSDSEGNIFVGTNQGIFKYDRYSDNFVSVVSTGLYTSIKIDNHNNIWFNGNIYNPKENKKDSIVFEQKKQVQNSVCFDDNGAYIGTFGNIYRLDNATKKTSLLLNIGNGNAIISLAASKEYLWALSVTSGLYQIDIKTNNIVGNYDFFRNSAGGSVPYRFVHVDKNDKIWIGSQQGVFVLDPRTKKYRHFTNIPENIFSLPYNSAWVISEDAQRNLWIGTYCGGLCYVNLDEWSIFDTYKSSDGGLNNNVISCFAEDNNNILVGTEGGGINCIDKRTGKFSYYMGSGSSNSISFDNIKSLVCENNNIWVAMFRGGLDCINTNTHAITKYSTGYDESKLVTNSLRKIIIESNKGLWIAYQKRKTTISSFSFADKSFTHYDLDSTDLDQYVIDMCIDNNNYLWCITQSKLYRLDLIKKTHSIIPLDESSKLIYAQSILFDKKRNCIWIGTNGKGLVKYDIQNNRFEPYDHMFNDESIRFVSICEDKNGMIWAGTNKGLLRCDINNGSYIIFTGNDGAQGSIFYPTACMVASDDQLYFGGTSGFSVVHPDSIRLNNVKPKVMISDFFINYVPATPAFKDKTKFYSNGEIILTHKQADFGFKFSSDNYLSPQKSIFRYRLKGYDDKWIVVDANNRQAQYAKVPAGVYYFEVSATNNDHVWGDPLVIKIVRQPSPWLSWWAFMIYGFIALVICYYFFRNIEASKRLKMQLYLDNLDKSKKDEIHQAQLSFFTNISHDFRTPLSLILATLDNLKREGVKESYYRILSSNASRLLKLVNELMDYRKVEEGKMALKVEQTNINTQIEQMACDFNDLALKKNLEYAVNCDPLIPHSVYIDRSIIEKVVMNLLNNSFKYTIDGKVSIETYSNPEDFKSEYSHSYCACKSAKIVNPFLIVARDTGIGISEETISNVFDRFYQVESDDIGSHLGSGVGLALVRSLIVLHKGSITIFSEKGKGTDMVIALSKDKDTYSIEEMFEDKDDEINKEIGLQSANDVPVNDVDDLLLRNKKRLLLVEDNNDLRKLIASSLQSYFDIKEAANGDVASKYVKENDVDLIISDIMMPVKDGITLCKELKSNDETSHIPFIMLTAKTGTDAMIDGVDSGADVYLEKPIDLNLLLLTIRNVFTQQTKLREYYSRNFFVESVELSNNEIHNAFLKKLIDVIDRNLTEPVIDVNFIASELSMSRSKLYSKIKALTGKSIVEFILNYRLRKAARILIEQDVSIKNVMELIGIKSQSYFTNAFKNEFGETPAAFVQRHKVKVNN